MNLEPLKSHYFLLLALAALPALAWTGLLDDVSGDHINTSLGSAGVIYGTARGINALVSLLQGTELNLVFLTVSIGEVLDPVNDLIERFSGVILFALGSLALQKILLIAVSHQLFNLTLTAFALGSAASLLLKRETLYTPLLKCFVIVVFLRFSLALVVLANHWVDATFLREPDRQRHAAMMHFEGELETASALARQQENHSESIAALQHEIRQLRAESEQAASEAQKMSPAIQAQRKELTQLQNNADIACRVSTLSPTCPETVARAAATLGDLQRQRDYYQQSQASAREHIERKRSELDCLERKTRGEACSMWDKLPAAPNIRELQNKLEKMQGQVGVFADNAITLLTSILLKSVVIPLLFFYILIRFTRAIWLHQRR